MAYDSRTYRILIASPSDVDAERDIAVRVIQEWNDLYSYSRNVVLLPLRWETHTAPEYGTRPQEVINRAIVDNCDLLPGIFWTRVGTPTGAADSGTLEEIERVAKAGKPVMLYFSKVGMDPEGIDVAQWQRLKAFKEQTYSNALTETFKSQIEFRDKLARQLELKVREVEREDRSGQPPPLSLGFTSDRREPLIGPSAEIPADVIEVIDMDLTGKDAGWQQRILDAAEEKTRTLSGVPVLLAIRNSGSSGIRNLYVEMVVTATPADVEVARSLARPSLLYQPYFGAFSPDMGGPELTANEGGGWQLSFEWDALQPQRTRTLPLLYILIKSDARVEFKATVFADSFPEPVVLSAELTLNSRVMKVPLSQLVPDVDSLKEINRFTFKV